MDNDRYSRMIQYKSALDDSYKRRNPLSIYADEYDKTLNNAKLAGFKILRNSKGEHKLEDITKSNIEVSLRNTIADYMR